MQFRNHINFLKKRNIDNNFENIERYLLPILDFLEYSKLKQCFLSFRFLLVLFSIVNDRKVFMLKIINY